MSYALSYRGMETLLNRAGDLREIFGRLWASVVPAGQASHAFVAVAPVAAWLPWLTDAAALLDARESARAGRMRRTTDAQSRTLAYALHRLLLGRMTGLEPADVPLSRDGRGRPVLEGHRWQTSLSHADGAFAIAACLDERIGVDLERLDRSAEILEIADEICHADESAVLRTLPGHVHRETLLALWTRKEAYLKASGVGLAHAMTAFALDDGAVLPLVGDVRGRVVRTTSWPLLPGYVAALSCSPELRPVTLVLAPP